MELPQKPGIYLLTNKINGKIYGHRKSVETRKKMSESQKKRLREKGHPLLGVKWSEERIEKYKEWHRNRSPEDYKNLNKPVKQIDKNTGEVIKIWPSIKGAAIGLGNSSRSARIGISKVLTKKLSKQGYYFHTALGFKWEYV